MENEMDLSGMNLPDPKDWIRIDERIKFFESMIGKEVYCTMTFRQDYSIGAVYTVTPEIIGLVRNAQFDGIKYEG